MNLALVRVEIDRALGLGLMSRLRQKALAPNFLGRAAVQLELELDLCRMRGPLRHSYPIREQPEAFPRVMAV
jgi:hypothetical protein